MRQLLRLTNQSNNIRQLCKNEELCRAVHFKSSVLQSTNRDTILTNFRGGHGTCRTLGQFVNYRGLSVSSFSGTRSNIGVGSGQYPPDEESVEVLRTSKSSSTKGALDSAWAIRLANENGYLSWCRNSYLASAVACGMQAEGTLEVSQLAAQGVFLLAGINLIWGTTSFVLHILALRKRVQMSLVVAALNITGAVLHLLTWLALVTMYLGLTEEELPEQKPSQGEDV